MQTLYHPSQLPGAIKKEKRQRDVLQASVGFSEQDKATLDAIYSDFITKGTEILNKQKES